MVSVPAVVIGLPETAIPVPGETTTDVTEPLPAVPALAETMRPAVSTVMVDSEYVPADTPVLVRLIANVPEVVTGPPVTETPFDPVAATLATYVDGVEMAAMRP